MGVPAAILKDIQTTPDTQRNVSSKEGSPFATALAPDPRVKPPHNRNQTEPSFVKEIAPTVPYATSVTLVTAESMVDTRRAPAPYVEETEPNMPATENTHETLENLAVIRREFGKIVKVAG